LKRLVQYREIEIERPGDRDQEEEPEKYDGESWGNIKEKSWSIGRRGSRLATSMAIHKYGARKKRTGVKLMMMQ